MILAFAVGIAFSGKFPTLLHVFLGVVSVCTLVIGFNAFNAIYDKKIDAINKPYRPLPSRAVGKSTVLNISIACFVISILAALSINTIFLAIDLIGIALAVLYSHNLVYLKRFFFVGTLIGDLTFGLIYPLEGWALTPSMAVPWYVIAFLLVVGFATAALKDFEDYKGDIAHKIKTIPVVFGYHDAAKQVTGIFFLALLILLGLIITGNLGTKYIFTAVIVLIGAINAYSLTVNHSKNFTRRAFLYGMLLLAIVDASLVILSYL